MWMTTVFISFSMNYFLRAKDCSPGYYCLSIW